MRWLALIAAITFAPGATAMAWTFSPTMTPFTISGGMSFSGGGLSVDCKVLIAGNTAANGDSMITAASFMGGTLSTCDSIHPLNLPWTVKAVDGHGAMISSISVRAPIFGDCVAHDVPVVVVHPGLVHVGHVDMPPACAIEGGDLKSEPPVAIVP